MNAREKALNYQPRIDVAHISKVDLADEGDSITVWSIYLTADATIIELAVLMSGLRKLGMETAADTLLDGTVVVRPREDGTRCPTAHQIAQLLMKGFDGRPSTLLLRQAS